MRKNAGGVVPSKKQDKQTNEKISNMILNRNQFAFGFMNLKVHRHLLFDPVVLYLSIFFPSTSWKAYCRSHKFVSEQNSSTYKKSLYLQGSCDPQCKGKEEAGEVLANTIDRLHGSLGITLCTSQTLYLYFHSSRKSAQSTWRPRHIQLGIAYLRRKR